MLHDEKFSMSYHNIREVNRSFDNLSPFVSYVISIKLFLFIV